MNNRKINVILTIFSLFFTTQCGQSDETDLIEPKTNREFTTVYNDERLSEFKNSMETASSSGRVSSAILNRVNWSKVYKVYDSKTDLTTFTIPLIVNLPNQYENLI